MKEVNDANKTGVNSSITDTTTDSKYSGRKSKKHQDIDVTPDSAFKVNLEEQLKRKKARAEKMAAAVQEEIVKDPVY